MVKRLNVAWMLLVAGVSILPGGCTKGDIAPEEAVENLLKTMEAATRPGRWEAHTASKRNTHMSSRPPPGVRLRARTGRRNSTPHPMQD